MEALTAHRHDALRCADRCPGATMGMHVGEARFIPGTPTSFRRRPLGISMRPSPVWLTRRPRHRVIFRRCRLRFQTNPARLRMPVNVFTGTGAPPAASWRARNAVKVSGASRAHGQRRSLSARERWVGAPQRGRSGKPARPWANQRRRVALTVGMLSAC
jgi:hypothetical protein